MLGNRGWSGVLPVPGCPFGRIFSPTLQIYYQTYSWLFSTFHRQIYAVCFLPLEFVKANCPRLDLISELNNYEGKRSCQSLSWSVVDWYTLQLIVIIIIIVFGGEPGPKNKLLFRSANLMDHSALLYYPSKQFLYGGALNIWHLNYIDIFSVYIILLAFQLTSVR